MSAEDLNTAAFEEVQKMFSTFEKKSAERDMVMSSLAKQVENLTAITMAVLPRGTTRIRGRRLDFATPSDRSDNAHGKPCGKIPKKSLPRQHGKTREIFPLSRKIKEKEKSGTSTWIRHYWDNLQGCLRESIPHRPRHHRAHQRWSLVQNEPLHARFFSFFNRQVRLESRTVESDSMTNLFRSEQSSIWWTAVE